MSKRKVYWKVIRKRSRSSVVASRCGVAVTYPVGEWVEPKIKNSKLMVFKNKLDALDFCGDDDTSIVVPCHINGACKINYILYHGCFGYAHECPKNLRAFWNNLSEVFPA